MIDWIINNYEWFFSGLGVFLLSVIWLLIRHQMTKKSTLKNINIGDGAQVNIIQSVDNVQISPLKNLKGIDIDQILRELLKEKKTEMLKLETEPVMEKEVYNPEKRKAMEDNKRAVQLARESKYGEALIWSRKAINIDREEELYKENLVVITENYACALILDGGLFDKGVTLMEELMKEGLLSDGYGYWTLGYAYYKKKLYEQAISAYHQAKKFEPKNYLHCLYLAEAYSDKGIKDNDLNYQEKALKEIELSLRLNPQEIKEIKSDDLSHPSFAEVILLGALTEINKGDTEQIKTEYKDFLLRVGRYSSNEIDEIIKEGPLSFTIAAIAIERFKNTVEEEIGSRVDLDTMIHGVKTIEEIQAMVKKTTNREIPILALSKLLQTSQLNEEEKVELVTDLVQQFGEEEIMIFAKELDKILKKRKRWIIMLKEDESIRNIA